MKANLFLCPHTKQFKIHQRPSLSLRMKVLGEKISIRRALCKGIKSTGNDPRTDSWPLGLQEIKKSLNSKGNDEQSEDWGYRMNLWELNMWLEIIIYNP